MSEVRGDRKALAVELALACRPAARARSITRGRPAESALQVLARQAAGGEVTWAEFERLLTSFLPPLTHA